jgi:hypothetical protein
VFTYKYTHLVNNRHLDEDDPAEDEREESSGFRITTDFEALLGLVGLAGCLEGPSLLHPQQFLPHEKLIPSAVKRWVIGNCPSLARTRTHLIQRGQWNP